MPLHSVLDSKVLSKGYSALFQKGRGSLKASRGDNFSNIETKNYHEREALFLIYFMLKIGNRYFAVAICHCCGSARSLARRPCEDGKIPIADLSLASVSLRDVFGVV